MNIAVLLYNGVADLDALSLYGVLGAATTSLGEEASLYTVARSRMSVQTAGGLVVTPHWAFMSAPPPDVLVIPGGDIDRVKKDRAVMAYLGEHAARVQRCLAVGSGAFLLGELGLLRDLEATAWAGALERLRDYEVGAIQDAPVVKNANGFWFAGGGARALDAGLALVHDLFGAELAQAVALRLELPAPDAGLT
jgi:transcriptional regulator GlxA family with amidase domain